MARHSNGQFQKGTGGRPAGARNKLQAKFVSALQSDFDEHGEGVIRFVRADDPAVYLKIIASILPKELQIGDTALDNLTEEDTVAYLDAIRQLRTKAA